ncbi:MAG TPA: ADP compounds hydrolase NudE, partial [Rhodanobacteraceae bacterium]|nr:ADP compounds hydrolase NudE [Rhodanobacteraceae bacterium]
QVILAQDLYPQRLPGDEPEMLEVVPWKLADLNRLLVREDVSEGRSIAALFIAREYLEGRFHPTA